MQHLAESFNLLPNLLGDTLDTQSLLLFAVATAKDSTSARTPEEMTRRYADLMIEDLQAIHKGCRCWPHC